MFEYLKNRLREPSTYAGIIVTAASYFHFTASDSQVQLIAAAAAAVAGAVLAFLPDRAPK